MRFLLLIASLASLPVGAEDLQLTPAEVAASATIDAAALRGPIRFLASDLLEGRGPGTRGDALTQLYLATEFEALGLSPLGKDGSYLQPFALLGVDGHPATVTINGGSQPLTLKYNDDFMAVSGDAKAQTQLDASELVFAGYGIVAPEFKWDDYKGVSLKGKTVILLNNDPSTDPNLFAGNTRLWYGRWDYKFLAAAKAGAKAAIIVHTTPSAGYPWQVIQSSWSGEQFELPAEKGPKLHVRAWTTEEATRKLVALSGKSWDALVASAQERSFKPLPLGLTVNMSFTSKVRRSETANVMGLLKGSDPKLAAEVVVYTAHHDHLGKTENTPPGVDGIHNGAVDNASGVAAMLTVARAFKALPQAPRRSILFAAVAGEEQGLLGSEYLSTHLPFPAGRLAANINVDSFNIWGRTQNVMAIGMGKSSLDKVLVSLAKRQGRTVEPDQMPDRGYFYRSDQISFAKLGVPATFFSSGLNFVGRPAGWGKAQHEAWEEKHYHQPSDELTPAWDFSGAVEDTQLYFQVGAVVARQDALPQWNPGDEFEAARLKALKVAAQNPPRSP